MSYLNDLCAIWEAVKLSFLEQYSKAIVDLWFGELKMTDFSGNVIGFSSAAVREDGIACFTPALDALAVIVHRDNVLSSVTLADLFGIFSGRVRFFEQLIEESAP